VITVGAGECVEGVYFFLEVDLRRLRRADAPFLGDRVTAPPEGVFGLLFFADEDVFLERCLFVDGFAEAAAAARTFVVNVTGRVERFSASS
jgi:hypothetical protein